MGGGIGKSDERHDPGYTPGVYMRVCVALRAHLRPRGDSQTRTLTRTHTSSQVLDAIDAFVFRLMGTSDKAQLKEMSSEFSAAELSKVLMWLLVVGYALRTAEVKLEALTFREDGGNSSSGNSGAERSTWGTHVGGVLGLGQLRNGGGGGGAKPNWGGGLSGWRRFLPGA
jgi:hypothetical protein